VARLARFVPKQTADGWRLNIPARFSESGKRERHFYPTREKAVEAAKRLREDREKFGQQARAIAPSFAEQAHEAAELLAPFGVSLVEVARRFAEEESRRRRSAMVSNAVAEFRRRKDGRSEKQQQAYRLMAEKLEAEFGERPMCSITGEEIEAHLERATGGPGAFNQGLRLIGAFWRWSARPPREWCDAAVVGHVERKEAVSGHIATLSSAEAKRLMRAAERHHRDAVIPFAIALFTGMRRQEIERLEPEDFSPEGITVPALSAKTRRRRFIHMPEPLARWLAAYPMGETVLPANWQRKEKAVRRLAGWRVWSDLIDPPEPPGSLPPWPENALRHTAASVALALGKPIETLVFEHGHAGGLATLRNHYIGQVSKKEAREIWELAPEVAP